jgi:sialic acid synthase SpsE
MHEASDVFKYMQAYKTLGKNKNLVFYHCTSLYPTPDHLERLDRIPYFKMGGFSYHGTNVNSIIYAAMNGVEYVELHFNHERNAASFKSWHWQDVKCIKEQCEQAKICVPNSILTMDECRNFQYYKNEFLGLKAC